MASLPPLPRPRRVTHTVENQVPPVLEYNSYTQDRALREAVAREGAPWAQERLTALGARLGEPEVMQWGMDANRFSPVLKPYDRLGNRIDEVEYHQSYHQLMALSVQEGLHCGPWMDAWAGAHVARAAAFFLVAQNELGHACPISMTCSVVPALRAEPALAARWEPGIMTRSYDPRCVPADQKSGLILGMAMTEKQGGSDVRTNTTVAVPFGDDDGIAAYLLTGHKWFCSAPMCDAFLVLGQAPGGLTCFLMPRWTPEGTRNGMFLQRLKDKLGNRSNASSEIELDQAFAWRVGEEGRGIRTILEMVQHTRLDCTIGAAALMRQSVAQLGHHTRYRAAFGRPLIAQPLMAAVLADLALESEASTALALRLAAAYDAADDASIALRRLLTPVAKFHTTRRAVAAVAEALEGFGGAGYVEEHPMARHYREVPVYGIWEGSGNVIALDVIRALQKSPSSVDALWSELSAAQGLDRRLDAFVGILKDQLPRLAADVRHARRLCERIALAVQGALLVRHAPHAIAAAFCETRLDGHHGLSFGTLSDRVDVKAVLERAVGE